MITSYLIIIAIIYSRSLRNIYRLLQNIGWIERSSLSESRKSQKTKFIVCIPAYKEQSGIIETINYFLSLEYPPSNLSIVVVTTQKEGSSRTSTRRIVESYLESADETTKKRLSIVHYPRTDGYMAHQVNFASEILSSKLKSSYFVIYNADSRPDKHTFTYVSAAIQQYRTKHKTFPPILQQSAIYTTVRAKNQSALSYSLGSGAAMHQTLWTLTQELTRLKNQSSHIPKLKKRHTLLNSIFHSRYAHSVGHGLFVQGSHYLSHKLPQDVLNEDMQYGLLQSSLRNAISPIALLEIALSPSKIRSVYKQKSVWFNPFFEYHTSLKNLLKNKQYKSPAEPYILTTQAYASLLIWLFHSVVWIAGLVLGALLGYPYFLLWAVGLLLYWFIPSFITMSFVRRIQMPINVRLVDIFTGTLYVLTHSVGPFMAMFRWIWAAIQKRTPAKPKTENL